jgi:hypothetical protein
VITVSVDVVPTIRSVVVSVKIRIPRIEIKPIVARPSIARSKEIIRSVKRVVAPVPIGSIVRIYVDVVVFLRVVVSVFCSVHVFRNTLIFVKRFNL